LHLLDPASSWVEAAPQKYPAPSQKGQNKHQFNMAHCPLDCTQAAAYRTQSIDVDVSATTVAGPQAARYLAQQVRHGP